MLYSAHIMALTEDSGQDNDSEERRFGKDSNGEIDLLQVVLCSHKYSTVCHSTSNGSSKMRTYGYQYLQRKERVYANDGHN